MPRTRSGQSKRLSDEQLLGERGVHFVAERFLEIGFPWHPTNAPLDAGIDGHIEIRDPATREATNTWIAVQVKSRTKLERENAETFDFTCVPRDLDYWRRGNMPVVLVVTRPGTQQAWWISVKDYFRDATRANARKIVFDKRSTSLDAGSCDKLLALAQAAGNGTYFRPAPKKEILDTNLLRASRLPNDVFRAETDFQDPAEITKTLKGFCEYPDREWLLHEGAIYSVHDLREGIWTHICERGTVERFSGVEWSETQDADVRRRFVWLLNECLRSLAARIGMRWRKDLGLLYFKASKDLKPWTRRYRSRQQMAEREVFRGYFSKTEPSRLFYYRHLAFEPRFRRFDGIWCLEINPTYLFTSDGREVHAYHQEYLSKMKAIEGSGAVGNVVVSLAAMLNDVEGLFATQANYRHLGFSELLSVEVDVGINEQAWAKPRVADQGNGPVDADDAEGIVSAVENPAEELFTNDELTEGGS